MIIKISNRAIISKVSSHTSSIIKCANGRSSFIAHFAYGGICLITNRIYCRAIFITDFIGNLSFVCNSIELSFIDNITYGSPIGAIWIFCFISDTPCERSLICNRAYVPCAAIGEILHSPAGKVI